MREELAATTQGTQQGDLVIKVREELAATTQGTQQSDLVIKVREELAATTQGTQQSNLVIKVREETRCDNSRYTAERLRHKSAGGNSLRQLKVHSRATSS